MLPTRIFYLSILALNTAVNGLALLAAHGGFVAYQAIIDAALVFNLLLVPVIMYAAYRMGGLTEEIYHQEAERAAASAGAAAAAQSEAARQGRGAAQAAGGAGQEKPARPPRDPGEPS